MSRFAEDGYPLNRAVAIASAVDGSVVIAVDSRMRDPRRGDPGRFVTVKYDRSGREIWTRSYSGPQSDARPRGIAVGPAGNIVVAGQARRNHRRRDWDFALIQYDSDGNFVWEAAVDGAMSDDELTALALHTDGKIAVTGRTDDGPVCPTNVASRDVDYLTAVFDSDGRQLWTARYDGWPVQGWAEQFHCYPSIDIAYDVQFDHLGRVVVTGESALASREPRPTAGIEAGQPIEHWVTIQYSADGLEEWLRVYEHEGLGAAPRDLDLDAHANVYVTGYGFEMEYEALGLGVVKYSGSGEEKWRSRHDHSVEGGVPMSVVGHSIAVENEDTLYVGADAGFLSVDLARRAEIDALTLRYSPHAFVRGDCNGDGHVVGSVADALFLLRWLFLSGHRPPCLAACDADGDGQVAATVTDALYLLQYNFAGGRPPLEPFPDCAPLEFPEDRDLGCGATANDCD